MTSTAAITPAEATLATPVIAARQLGKCYQIYDNPNHRLRAVFMPWGRRRHHDFWALRDATFEVRAGEAVGILGRNGSGKSTLLQLAAGILRPSEGEIVKRGRVSALLELGSGFNPEFTGRENVYLNGAVLGINARQMTLIFDEIAAFADIGAFIDQPVKTYSSGMMIRLAFAVAVAVGPDILIVDEALAVGDIAFQRKCFRRVEELRARGMTLLWVTHDPSLIRQICNRALVLDRGRIIGSGDAGEMADLYIQVMYGDGAPRLVTKPEAAAAEATEGTEGAEGTQEIEAEESGEEVAVDGDFAFSAVPEALRFDFASRLAGVYHPDDIGAHNVMTPFALTPGRYHLELNLACETKKDKSVEIMVADWKRGRVALGTYPPLTCDTMTAKILAYDFEVNEELPEAEVRVTNLGGAAIRLGSLRLWRVDPADRSTLESVARAEPARMKYFNGRERVAFETEPALSAGLAKIVTRDELTLDRAALFDAAGQPRAFFRVDEEVMLVVEARVLKAVSSLSYGILLRDKLGQEIFGRSQTQHQMGLAGPFAVGEKLRFKVTFRASVRQETYFISFGLSDAGFLKNYFYGLDLVQMPLLEAGERVYGIAHLPSKFEAARLEGE